MRGWYARGVGGLPTLSSPAPLAPDRTPLFGRSEEIERLLLQLERGSRLITITGPSGMGKTRVALQVARRAAARFAQSGGAYLVRLGACRSDGDVQAAVAQALGITHRQGVELARAIADRGPLLLLLDNLEHLAPASRPSIETWLDHCADLQILAVSIVPLQIEGELRFELGPLDLRDAVELYIDRATRAWADREVSPEETKAIEELVGRLDRLPLAIELAAARVRVLPPRQLLARISERFALLRTSDRGRHGSLLEALSLSWDLLSEDERTILAKSSCFEGGFTLQAAEAVLASGPLDAHLPGVAPRSDLLGLLDGLRSKALLQLEEGAGAEPRFSLYESVRAFASRHLREVGLEETTIQDHAVHFVREAERQSEACHGPDAPKAIRWLSVEAQNILAAQRRCATSAPALGARAGISLAEILAFHGPPSMELEILDRSVSLAGAAGDSALLCKALWVRTRAKKRQGLVEAARSDVQAGLRLARAGHDETMEGHLLLEAGALAGISGDHETALEELARAEELARRLGDLRLEGATHLVLGVTEENRGNLEAAWEATLEALRIFRTIDHLRYQGVALLNLGAIGSHLGRFSEAQFYLQQARSIFRLLENPAYEANVVTNLGSVAQTAGNLEDAERYSLEVLEMERSLGNRRLHALSLGALAAITLERGQLHEAVERFTEATLVLAELQEWRYHASHRPFHAVALARLGKFDRARIELDASKSAFEGAEDERSLRVVVLANAIVDLVEAQHRGDDTGLDRCRARLQRLLTTEDGPRGTEAWFVTRRLAEQALRGEVSKASGPPLRSLRFGRDASWFQWGDEQRVELRNRTAIRRMALALARQRLEAPGAGLPQEALVEVGWPGERILPEAAATRVYSGIRTLRRLGLAPALLRHADGYLFDPEVPVELQGGT